MDAPLATPEVIPATLRPKAAAPALRLTQLDALRGLAALGVFLGHAFAMMAQRPAVLTVINKTPLCFFYDGETAVRLFFVLSGFVLNLKYCAPEPRSPGWPWAFIVRRIFRIYPALFAAVLLALAFRLWVFEPDLMRPFSSWFANLWAQPIPWHQVPKVLTLLAPRLHPEFIDPPLWSLVYEMRISLVFPLIIWVVNAPRRCLWDGALLAACYVLCFFLANTGTFLFLPMFVLGAMCAKYFDRLRPWLSGWDLASKGLWLVGSLLLYEMAAIHQPQTSNYVGMRFLCQQFVGLGAAGLILACGSFRSLGALLDRRLLQFIGRTSYSFYLVHMVILLGVAPLIFRTTASYLVTWSLCLLLAYLLSAAVFEYIEVPGIRCGAWVCRSVVKSRARTEFADSPP